MYNTPVGLLLCLTPFILETLDEYPSWRAPHPVNLMMTFLALL